MNLELSDWHQDVPAEEYEEYENLITSLKRKEGFGLFFVQCTHREAEKLIAKIPHDLPDKKIEVLRLTGSINKLYDRVLDLHTSKQFDILLIKNLEYSLYKYEKRTFGEITEGQFSNLSSVPPILNHLNQQRERFRDYIHTSLVFLLRPFSINYLIHRAPDFYDWRSGLFELPTTSEFSEEELLRVIGEGDDEGYLNNLTNEEKIEKMLEIQELLTDKNLPEFQKARLFIELGNILYYTQEYVTALSFYDDSLKIDSNSLPAWYRRGNTLFNLQLYEEAIISYEKAIKSKPDEFWPWYGKGEALRLLKNNQEAIICYKKAIKLNQNNFWVWYHQGLCLSATGDYQEAIFSYEQAISINSNHSESWGYRGIAFYYLGEYKKAVESYDRAIALAPDLCPGIYYYKACALALQNMIKPAIENLKYAIAVNPDKYRAKAKDNSDFDSMRENEFFQALIPE